MDISFNSKGTILHGSPYQNLEIVNSTNARYHGKVFGTYNFQRALRYIASSENGGDSVFSNNDNLFILNANPDLLIKENGSIYIVPNNLFASDNHKGEEPDWIYSTTEELKVIAEIQFINVLEVWNTYNIYAVTKDLSKEILRGPSLLLFNKSILFNKEILRSI